MALSAVFALLIGIAADAPALVDMPVDEAVLAPEANGAPERPGRPERGRRGVGDAETVSNMPPGMSSITIERRIIIRIPILRPPGPGAARQPMFALPPVPMPPAGRGRPVCVAMRSILGATVHDRAGIFFTTNVDTRYQAVLERGCRPADFQSGFYLSATPDGALCEGRDMVHARSGSHCTITGLRRVANPD